MEVEVLFYGPLTDIAGKDPIWIEDAVSTIDLMEKLKRRFPLLEGSHFALVVDQHIVQGKAMLPKGCRVSLLPPYSGG